MESSNLFNLLQQLLGVLNSNDSPNLINCSVYSNISYFMVFSCCGKPYCCNNCHNLSESHTPTALDIMICNNCKGPQKLRMEPNSCEVCGIYHPALIPRPSVQISINPNNSINSASNTQSNPKRTINCQVYSNISYWMIYSCCKNLYCCRNCHDKDQSHTPPKCTKMVCFDCGAVQGLRNEPNNCESCSSNHPALTSGVSSRLSSTCLPCKSYSNISYFMVFNCCGNLYCCPVCHNNKETHQAAKCLEMVCMRCGGKQALRNEPNNCEICKVSHPALISKLKSTGAAYKKKNLIRCQSFSNASYWMIFPCCNNLYCCDQCHRNDQGHNPSATSLMVCFDCGGKQQLRYEPNNCEVCSSFHPALKKGISTMMPNGYLRCTVYRNISYFMVFPCCNNLYCCQVCHNNQETHAGQGCSDMVCFYCGGRQKLRNEPNQCDVCGKNHPALIKQ